jgi:hypothetical protein
VLHVPETKWLLWVPSALMLKMYAFYPHSVFIYFLLFSQYTTVVSVNSINLLIFIVEVHCILRSAMTEKKKLSTMQTNVRLQCFTVELEFFF